MFFLYYLVLFGFHVHCEAKYAALASTVRVHADLALVQFDELLYDGQAETDAFVVHL